MLTAADALRTAGRRRPLPSLTHMYHDYLMQRIEAFKESVTRDEAMRLAGEATAGLQESDEGQMVLTEMLVGEVMDQLIIKKLKLKSSKKFREHVVKLRVAQREPTHWGLDGLCPIVPLLRRFVATDRALVVGAGAEACACLIAAHDVEVMFWASDPGVLDRVDQRVATESLSARFLTMVVSPGGWEPDVAAPFDIVVVDLAALADLDAATKFDVIRGLQSRTNDNGLHVLLPSSSLVPEAVFTFYEGWKREEAPRKRKGVRPSGCVLVKPEVVSKRHAARA